MAKTTKDTPLAEITLRRYEKPYDLPPRELVKKLCLSLGLLQPGDSRDVIADVLLVLLEAKMSKAALSSEEIKDRVVESRRDAGLQLYGVASSNIRRQLKRLRALFLVEKVKNTYRITEFAPLHNTFEEKIERFLVPSITERIKEYLKAVDTLFTSKATDRESS